MFFRPLCTITCQRPEIVYNKHNKSENYEFCGQLATGLCCNRLSLFSFIHPFTALTLIFCRFSDGIITPNSCIQMQFPLPTPCLNVALNKGVRASTIWINIENGEWGKSLVITPQWSNTFGPDCRLHLVVWIEVINTVHNQNRKWR